MLYVAGRAAKLDHVTSLGNVLPRKKFGLTGAICSRKTSIVDFICKFTTLNDITQGEGQSHGQLRLLWRQFIWSLARFVAF